MAERMTPEQVKLLLPEDSRHPVQYGVSLELAVRLPGTDWAENVVRAGHVPSPEGLDLLLKGRLLANRAHLGTHQGTFCPSSWADCLDVIPAYLHWVRLLNTEGPLHLRATRIQP
jgi:hypothetical protein